MRDARREQIARSRPRPALSRDVAPGMDAATVLGALDQRARGAAARPPRADYGRRMGRS